MVIKEPEVRAGHPGAAYSGELTQEQIRHLQRTSTAVSPCASEDDAGVELTVLFEPPPAPAG